MSQTIVMAMEPHEKKAERVRGMLMAARTWSKSSRPRLKAVSYITPMDLGWPPNLYSMLRENSPELRDPSIFPALQKISAPLLKSVRICKGSSTSKREGVSAFLLAAERARGDLIIAGTHGRRGLNRFRMGSFAETLVSTSKIPVMVVNDKAKVPSQFKTIFFAADFSPACSRAFKYVLGLAVAHKAELVVFHGFEPHGGVYFATTGMGPDAVLLAKSLEYSQRSQSRKGGSMVRAAHKRGLDCRFVMPHFPHKMGNEILRSAKAVDADLIVLPTRRGPISQTIFGKACLGPYSGLKMQESRFQAALKTLSDPAHTTVVLVVRPEKGAIAEAAKTSEELKSLGLSNQRLVVNAVFRATDPKDGIAVSLERVGAEALASMPVSLAALPCDSVPLRPFDTVGLA